MTQTITVAEALATAPESTRAAVQVVSLASLVSILSAFQKSTLVTVETRTVPAMRKTGNPFIAGGVFKESRFQAFLAFDYREAVNAARTREGAEADFEPSPRKWGTHLRDVNGVALPFIAHTHKGESAPKLYVQFRILRSLESEYFSANGTPIAKADIAPFLTERDSNADHQGLVKEIPVRDYGMGGILSLNVAGWRFMVDQSTVAEGMAEVAAMLSVADHPTIRVEAEEVATA